MYACVRAQLCLTLCDSMVCVARQAPPSMEFSRQEYWSELPFPTPGDVSHPRIELESPLSPALAGRFFTTEPNSKPIIWNGEVLIFEGHGPQNLEKQNINIHTRKNMCTVPRISQMQWSTSLRLRAHSSEVFINYLASLVAQLVKNLPAMWNTWVQSLGLEDPLEKGKATHSSILTWRIPWTVWSMGSQRVRHDWATFTSYQLSFLLCPPSVVPSKCSIRRYCWMT